MFSFLVRILIFFGLFSFIGRILGFKSDKSHFSGTRKQKTKRFKTSDKEVEDANFEEVN